MKFGMEKNGVKNIFGKIFKKKGSDEPFENGGTKKKAAFKNYIFKHFILALRKIAPMTILFY